MAYIIDGYDGEKKFWAGEVTDRIGEGGLVVLLQRLASRHLSPAEIIAASLRTDAPGFAPLLDVTEGPGNVLSVGQGFHYVARLRKD